MATRQRTRKAVVPAAKQSAGARRRGTRTARKLPAARAARLRAHSAPEAKPTRAPDAKSARERIIDAAAGIYALHGYEGSSLRAIAERAGVTKPLIFYHFASKRHLFSSLISRAIDECERVEREVSAPGLSAAQRVRRFIELHAELARQSPDIYAFAYDVFTKPRELPLEFDYKTKGQEIFHRWVTIVAAGQELGEFRRIDAQVAAAMPIAVLHMHALAVMSGVLDKIPDRIDDVLYQLLMTGLEERKG